MSATPTTAARTLGALASLAVMALSSCSAGDSLASASKDSGALPNQDTSDAQARLYAHDIVGARTEYEQLKQDGGGRAGGPAAGVALTSLLLLPYSPAFTRIITSHLGARDALDKQGDVLWGDQGLTYFLARGVDWDDTPSTAGIKTLLVDRLPWSRQQLDSVDGFVKGLNKPVALLAVDLDPLAGELSKIASELAIAVADEKFTTFFLPGQVFHDESLNLTLGKSELSLLRGAVKGVEAGIRFFAAYEHGWTIERVFGTSIWATTIADASDPDHIDGAEVIDYQSAHLNESLGRAVATAAQLDKAAAATGAALGAFADGIEFGAGQGVNTTLTWRAADTAIAANLVTYLRALEASVDGPTELPFTVPTQTAALGRLFDGRTLAAEEDLVLVDRFDDGVGIVSELAVDEAVLDAFLDGVFVPSLYAEPAPELTIADDIGRLIDGITSDFSNDFERAVGGSF